MLARLFSWILGYVVLYIQGENKERFLNLALQKGVEIYDVNWLDDSIIEAKINYRQIGMLRKISKITKSSFKIRHKKGLPFCYGYLKKRKALGVGLILFLLGIYVCSSFVFGVTVTNREPITVLDLAEVKAKAADLGLKKWAYISSLDFAEIEKNLAGEIPELSWVRVERHGTLLDIMVAERSIYPEAEENATVGAIWANRDALIEEILIKHGEAMVQAGDTVQKGQLLVSPLADGRADAIIKARVWYEGYGECGLQEKILQNGAKAERVFYLKNLAGKGNLILWGDDISEKTPKQVGENQLISSERFYAPRGAAAIAASLPLGIWEKTLTNQQVLYRNNSEAEAKGKALEQAKSSLKAQVGVGNKLIKQGVDYSLDKQGDWCAKVRWECVEEVGMRNRTD